MTIYFLDGADGQIERVMLIKQRKKMEAQEKKNKLLKQRLAKLEAAATELAELTNPLLEQDQMAIYRARVKVNNLCSSSPDRGTEEGE